MTFFTSEVTALETQRQRGNRLIRSTRVGPRRALYLNFSLVLVVAFSAAACSDGDGSSEEDFGSVIAQMREALTPPASEWATKVADHLSQQVHLGGEINDVVVERQLQPETAILNQKVCDEVRRQEKHLNLDSPSMDAETEIARIIEEATVVAIARRPDILLAIGMTTWGRWPPFALNDPAPAADSPVQDVRSAIGAHVKPEFVDKTYGGLALPRAGRPSYGAFQQWYFSPDLDNELLEQATFTVRGVRDELLGCVQNLRGS